MTGDANSPTAPTERRRVLASVGAALTAGVAGCVDFGGSCNPNRYPRSEGADRTGGDGSSLDAPAESVEVRMVSECGQDFVPPVVRVAVGGTVRWVLEGGTHNTVAYHPETNGDQRRIPDGAEPWDSGLLSKPWHDGLLSESTPTFERSFDVPGVYDYACEPHETRRMVGTVVVGDPDLADQPGLAAPSEEIPWPAREELVELGDRVEAALADGSGGRGTGSESGSGSDPETGASNGAAGSDRSAAGRDR